MNTMQHNKKWLMPLLRVFGLLMLIFTSTVGFSQTFSIVGTGTASNTSTGYPAPFGNYYYGARHQMFVTAAQLSAAGITAGSSIGSVGFNVSATNASDPLVGWNVKVFTTTNTNPISAGYVTTGMVASSTPTTYTPVTGWNQFNLSAPFIWNGTDNLVIETCFNNTGYNSNASTVWTTSGLGTGTWSRWRRADAAGVCGSTTTTSTSTTTRPNMRFGWISSTSCSGTPNAGTASSSIASACANSSFTLSASGLTSSNGITYQWQVSTDGGATWANIAGATTSSASVTQSVASSYQVVSTCATSSQTATSNVVNVAQNSFLDCYCASSATSTGDEDISNVTFGVLNNSSGCATVAPGPGSVASMYSNYKTLTPTAVTMGQMVPLSVTQTSCGGSYGNVTGVWIDYNHNGSFTDPGEQVLTGAYVTGNYTNNALVTIPFSALPGQTVMRVVNVESSVVSPCGTYTWGETEDYMIDIQVAVPCTGTPNPGNTIASTTLVCMNQTVNFTLQNQIPGIGVTYQWYNNAGPITGATNPFYSQVITFADDFYCEVSCSGGTAVPSNLVSIAMDSYMNCYCAANSQYGTIGGPYGSIFNVSLGSIANASSYPTASPYYTNYLPVAGTTTNMLPGTNYQLSVTVGGYAQAGVWFDFNQNGVFDAAEFTFLGNNSTGVNVTYTTNIAVPLTAPSGLIKMRIRGEAYFYTLTGTQACGNTYYGETEDYTITVDPLIPCMGVPNPGNTIASANNVCPGTNVTFTLQNSIAGIGVSFQWYNNAGAIAGATNSYYSQAISAPDDYYCMVSCAGSGQSSPSNLVSMTIAPFYNCYCASAATTTADEEIYQITVNGATTPATYANTNGCTTPAPGPGSVLSQYSNFTPLGPLTTLSLGQTVSFEVRENECDGATYYGNGIGIWIDYNHNGLFTDPGEAVYIQATTSAATGATPGGDKVVTGTFTVPTTALSGPTAMRVIAAEGYAGASLTPCLSYGYGETEDWVVDIAPLPATPANPIQANVPNCTTGGELAAVGTAPAGETWYWQTTATGTSTANPATTNLTIIANGTYYIRSQSNSFGTWSAGAGSITVTNFPLGPVDPTVSSPANPACGAVTLISSSAPSGATTYWQGTSAIGTSITQVGDDGTTNTPYTATANGTYYLRSRDNVTYCWSNPVAYSVTITPLPVITSVTTSASPICAGTQVQLTANVVGGTGGNAPTYCTSALTSGNYCGSGNITAVSITGTTLNNPNAVCTYTAANGDYLDYPATGNYTTTLILGQTYTLNVNCISGAIVSMFIDYNQNGLFEASEWTQVYTNNTTGSVSFTVPANATSGVTKMRIRSRLALNVNGATDACLSMGSGSTEDYTLTILNPVSYTYSWTGGGLSNSSIYNPTATPSSTTNYQVSVTNNSTGCTSTGNVNVNVLPIPAAPVTTGGATLCGAGPATLSATGTGGTLNWYNVPTGGTSIATGATYTTPLITANTTYYVEETNGTCIGPRSAVVATYTPADAVTASSSVSYVCSGGANNQAVLTASSLNTSYAYTWMPGGLTGNSVTVTPTSTTTYTVTGTDGVCSNVATVTVNVGVVPTVYSATATPASLCVSGTSQLFVDAGEFAPTNYCTPTVFYTGVTGDYIENFSINTLVNNLSGDYANDYQLYPQTTTVQVGSTYTISATPGALYGQGVGVWIDFNRNGSFGDPGEFVMSTASGTATVTTPVTIPATAVPGSTRVRVCAKYAAQPVATESCGHTGFGEYEDYIITISGGGGALTYAWSPAATLSSASVSSPVATVNATTTYTVSISDPYGCATSTSLTVTVNQPSSSTDNITACGSYTWAANGQTYTAAGTYTATSLNAGGCTHTSTLNLTIACNTTINLVCFIQGYWDGTSAMVPALFNQGEVTTTGACDSIDVELHSDVAPYGVDAAIRTVLNQNGTATCVFPPVTGNKYIAVKHRSALQTWSANPVAMSTTLSYDFSDADTKAYGSNMVQVSASPSVWAFFSGDVVVDENMDLLDLGAVESDISNFGYGYLPTDLNGDGNVDLLDSPMLETNISGFIYSNHP